MSFGNFQTDQEQLEEMIAGNADGACVPANTGLFAANYMDKCGVAGGHPDRPCDAEIITGTMHARGGNFGKGGTVPGCIMSKCGERKHMGRTGQRSRRRGILVYGMPEPSSK